MADQQKIVRDEIAGPIEENALLRASIMDLRQRLAEFEQNVDRDQLTALYNGRRFLAEIERVVAGVNRYPIPAALAYVELEGLEAIGRRHGALAGDAALIHLGGLLSSLVRSTDFVARVGNETFALVFEHLDHDSAIEAMGRIERCIAAAPAALGSAEAALEVSIGTAAILAGDEVQDVLMRADQSLRRAKARDLDPQF